MPEGPAAELISRLIVALDGSRYDEAIFALAFALGEIITRATPPNNQAEVLVAALQAIKHGMGEAPASSALH